MGASSESLSKAVTIYVGFGNAPSPRRDRAKLLAIFGATAGPELATTVEALLEEMGTIAVDWSSHSLESAGELARSEMHRRHPSLSEEALRALEWKFTYDWR